LLGCKATGKVLVFMYCCYLFSGVNVKTGELFPATFPDKGPDQALRSARHLTGGQQVILNSTSYKIPVNN